MKRYLLAILLLLLASCELGAPVPFPDIPIPIWGRDRPPFRESSLEFLEPGRTTHQEVRDTLLTEMSLTPNSRQDDSGIWWLYWATRGGVHWTDDRPRTMTLEFLLVEFDHEGVVRNYAVGNEDRPCDHSHGICFSWPILLRFADPESDRIAKQFRPDSDQCSLYIYLSRGVRTFSWYLDDRWLIDLVNDESYYRAQVAPGQHRLSRYPRSAFETVNFECNPGESLFFRTSDNGLYLEGEEARAGARAVRRRFLALESLHWNVGRERN